MCQTLIDAVAGDVAGLGVLVERIERLAFIGPLLVAVVARDYRPIAGWLGVGRSHQRRPIDGALAVAGRFAGGAIVVEDVERHALAVDQRFALGGIGRGCRRGLRQRRGDAEDTGSEKDRQTHNYSPWCLNLPHSLTPLIRLYSTVIPLSFDRTLIQLLPSRPASAAPAAESGSCSPSCASRAPSSRDRRKRGPCAARVRCGRAP